MNEERGNISPSERNGARKSWRMWRKKGRKAYKSLFKEELELVRRSSDLSLNGL